MIISISESYNRSTDMVLKNPKMVTVNQTGALRRLLGGGDS
jgi:hypothetical protein